MLLFNDDEFIQLKQIPDIESEVIDAFVVKFSGFSQYEVYREIQGLVTARVSQAKIKEVIEQLIDKKIVTKEFDRYHISIGIKLERFPEVLQNKKYRVFLERLQQNTYTYWFKSPEETLRDVLYEFFSGKSVVRKEAFPRLLEHKTEVFYHYMVMLGLPDYDQFWQFSIELNESFFDKLFYNIFHFTNDYDKILGFFERNPKIKGEYIIAQIELIRGNIEKALKACINPSNHFELLLRAQIELFRGNFEQSLELFDKARVTNAEGQKIPRIDFVPAYEYFFWLNYLFVPEKLNLKKLETFSKKIFKNRDLWYAHLMPLACMLKKDLVSAKSSLKDCDVFHENFFLLVNLMNRYIIEGSLSDKQHVFAIKLLEFYCNNQNWLFVSELQYMLEGSELKVSSIIDVSECFDHLPKPIMSNLVKQEKWEIALEGIENILGGANKTNIQKKDSKTLRVAYLINFDNNHIQPVLQTYNAKTGWTLGRNIAMKRFKEKSVEGMTEQDFRIASTVKSYSDYYGNDNYEFNTEKALTELCGHPYLFMFKNPSVPVELIKDEPRLYTEETLNGIKLKTNIAYTDKTQTIIRETQTRCRVVSLSPQQQKVVQMIHQGIVVPKKGKDKLLKTISQLSSVMSVHSDLAQEAGEMKTVEADGRIRLQIVPMGDGLKAEMFVKPFNTEPPYFKPGKGGKVAYGTVGNEKHQALRNLETEMSHAATINNALNGQLDADLVHEAVHFHDPYECLELLDIANVHKDIAVIEWPEGERFKLKKYASSGNLQLNIKSKNNWFEMEGNLQVDEETVLSVQKLLQLSKKAKGRFVELGDGEYLSLTAELKKQLDELAAFVQEDKTKLKINFFAAQAVDALTEQAGSFKADKAWKDLQKKIAESEKLEISLPTTLEAELRPYQEEGFRWLTRLNAWGAGACLADDMGLGKTLQAIATMLDLAPNGPSMVVCPASVINNWCNELTKFAPTLNPIVLKPGSARKETFAALSSFDVLVISYGLLQSEEENINAIDWSMAVLDEAHAIKNTNTKSSKAAMGIKAGFRMALTGTPVQNHLGELWSLFQFCNPGLLGSLQQFTERYVKSDLPEQKVHLKKLISPFILRRTKNKVLSELPPKTEITHNIELSSEELAFYEALRRQAISVIESGGGNAGQQHLQALAEITRLRLACCNPALVNADIVLPSSKLAAFIEIMEELRANSHRALVFSQFIGHLAIVRQSLDQMGVSYQYLDGSTSLPDREKAVKAFQAGKGELFLISLKAGGLGLNLTAADYVIHLDPWWNPAIEDQASDRAHRIGQTRPVTIYRLVAKNTIEEKILQLHAIKRDMADSLLEGTDQNSRLGTKELLELLREG